MKRARGRETATKPTARGASELPGASTQRPGPAGSHEQRRRSRAFFLGFNFFFNLLLPTSQFGRRQFFLLLVYFSFFFFFVLFSTSGIFCILFSLKKKEKKALTIQNPRIPPSSLPAWLSGDPALERGTERPRTSRGRAHTDALLPRRRVRGSVGLCHGNTKP